MNILFIGDIFASAGRGIVADKLHYIVSTENIDLTIANAENAAGGFGITPLIAEELLKMGIDVMTSGNHIWDKREILRVPPQAAAAASARQLLRRTPGKRIRGSYDPALASMSRSSTCRAARTCPLRRSFRKGAIRSWRRIPSTVKVRFVDFHAELTSEKVADGVVPGRPRLGDSGHAHSRPDGRHPRSHRRNRPTRPTSA